MGATLERLKSIFKPADMEYTIKRMGARLLIVSLILSTADAITTNIGLKLGGTELNPVWQGDLSLTKPVAILLKFIILLIFYIAVIGGSLFLLSTRYKEHAFIPVFVGGVGVSLLLACYVVNNIIVIARLISDV